MARVPADPAAVRERRGDDQLRKVEGEQLFAAELRRGSVIESERAARGDDLISGARESCDGASRQLHRGPRHVGDSDRRLHQQHVVPAVRGNGHDSVIVERGDVLRLQRLSFVDEPGGPGVRAQKHREVGVAHEKRLQACFVVGDEGANHLGCCRGRFGVADELRHEVGDGVSWILEPGRRGDVAAAGKDPDVGQSLVFSHRAHEVRPFLQD